MWLCKKRRRPFYCNKWKLLYCEFRTHSIHLEAWICRRNFMWSSEGHKTIIMTLYNSYDGTGELRHNVNGKVSCDLLCTSIEWITMYHASDAVPCDLCRVLVLVDKEVGGASVSGGETPTSRCRIREGNVRLLQGVAHHKVTSVKGNQAKNQVLNAI